MDDSDISNN
jgi:hypothetical protein